MNPLVQSLIISCPLSKADTNNIRKEIKRCLKIAKELESKQQTKLKQLGEKLLHAPHQDANIGRVDAEKLVS